MDQCFVYVRLFFYWASWQVVLFDAMGLKHHIVRDETVRKIFKFLKSDLGAMEGCMGLSFLCDLYQHMCLLDFSPFMIPHLVNSVTFFFTLKFSHINHFPFSFQVNCFLQFEQVVVLNNNAKVKNNPLP